MTAVAANGTRGQTVPVMLTGARVPKALRDALFEAAQRTGLTPSEYVLQAAAEKLAAPSPLPFLQIRSA